MTNVTKLLPREVEGRSTNEKSIKINLPDLIPVRDRFCLQQDLVPVRLSPDLHRDGPNISLPGPKISRLSGVSDWSVRIQSGNHDSLGNHDSNQPDWETNPTNPKLSSRNHQVHRMILMIQIIFPNKSCIWWSLRKFLDYQSAYRYVHS